MGKLRNLLLTLCLLVFIAPKAFCANVWINDTRALFQNNGAIIYGINIRTFNAKDKNHDGIIEESLGEERGTFLNAIDRLDELVAAGVNTIHLLPVTPVGKVKAFGTAGSLFAASSFDEINPQLKDPNSPFSVEEEMQKFVDECHQRGIRVIVDLPCCGAYDLYLKHPELFKKDRNQNPVIPADWTDVRLLDAGTETQINMDVYNLYEEFINLMISIGVDGIVADEASMKPCAFWNKLITKTRDKDPQFLFLAEASPLWKKSPCEYSGFSPYSKLLDAGFDGYYGSYAELKNWKNAKELYSSVKSDIEISKKYKNTKSVLGNFATHDQISPILINGKEFSKMIIWLSATLPMNSYAIDGFPTGDNYIYFWANKKAPQSYTDDEYYFVHRGQLDVFNFSRKPQGKNLDLWSTFVMANKFKSVTRNVVTNGTFTTLWTSSPSVFAYERHFDKTTIIVMGNLDFKKTQNVKVFEPKVNSKMNIVPIQISDIPVITKGRITTELAPGEVNVLFYRED